jgi:hypothetical protein
MKFSLSIKFVGFIRYKQTLPFKCWNFNLGGCRSQMDRVYYLLNYNKSFAIVEF